MRGLLPVVLLVGLTGLAFGQGHQGGGAWSLGGFGSVVYPGMGHAPTATPPVGTYRGLTGVGNPGYSRGFASPGHTAHPQHGTTVIVPYPVYYGGYYGYDPAAAGYANGPGPNDAGYAPDDGLQNGPGLPPVVINQNFVPPQANPQVRDYTGDQSSQAPNQPGMKLYQAPPSHPYADATQAASAASDQPTIYLIALKDHTVVQALGYWMQGTTLHYISTEHTVNQISSDLVDRDLSQRLNDERGLDFKLPAPH